MHDDRMPIHLLQEKHKIQYIFDDKIHLLVGETNKGWYNIHIAIDNSKAKCKDLETIQYGERI